MNGDLSLYKGSASVMMGTRPSNNGNVEDHATQSPLLNEAKHGHAI